VFDILEKITEERLKRGWSEYQLSVNSEIAQSTISTWYRKNMQPSVSSLEKVCSGLGITLAQFFSEGEGVILTDEQKRCLDAYGALNREERRVILELLETMRRRAVAGRS